MLLENADKAEYLGVTINANGPLPYSNIRRVKSVKRMAHAIPRAVSHSRVVTTATTLRVWETLIFPKAVYGIHLALSKQQLGRSWGDLEKAMLTNKTGSYSGKHKTRYCP